METLVVRWADKTCKLQKRRSPTCHPKKLPPTPHPHPPDARHPPQPQRLARLSWVQLFPAQPHQGHPAAGPAIRSRDGTGGHFSVCALRVCVCVCVCGCVLYPGASPPPAARVGCVSTCLCMRAFVWRACVHKANEASRIEKKWLLRCLPHNGDYDAGKVCEDVGMFVPLLGAYLRVFLVRLGKTGSEPVSKPGMSAIVWGIYPVGWVASLFELEVTQQSWIFRVGLFFLLFLLFLLMCCLLLRYSVVPLIMPCLRLYGWQSTSQKRVQVARPFMGERLSLRVPSWSGFKGQRDEAGPVESMQRVPGVSAPNCRAKQLAKEIQIPRKRKELQNEPFLGTVCDLTPNRFLRRCPL